MIGKVTRGFHPPGLVRYLMGPGKAEEHERPRVVASFDGDPGGLQPDLVGDGDFDFDPTQFGELIEYMTKPGRTAGLPDRAPKTGEPGPKSGWVWQCSLRNADTDRTLTDAQWREVAEDVMDRTGIAPRDDDGGCRWIAVRHADDHVHLMATLVRQDTGKRFHPQRDYSVVRTVAREWEQKLGLRVTAAADRTAASAPSRGELAKTARGTAAGRPVGTGGGDVSVTPRVRLRQVVAQTAAAKRGVPEFLDALRAEGLRVHENRGPDGKLRGYAVGFLGDTARDGRQILFGGGKLAPDLSLPKLQARWASAEAPEVTLHPSKLTAASLQDKTDALRYARTAVTAAHQAVTEGTESVDGIAHATADLLHAAARSTERRGQGVVTDTARVYDRAARTPGSANPDRWGEAARSLRMASWRIGMLGVIVGRGDGQSTEVAALLLALGALAAEIAANREAAGRTVQAAAARQSGQTLTEHAATHRTTTTRPVGVPPGVRPGAPRATPATPHQPRTQKPPWQPPAPGTPRRGPTR